MSNFPVFIIPSHWRRAGLVLARSAHGNGSHVVGDPCIVWDETIPGWRMVLFFDPPGTGESVSHVPSPAEAGQWSAPIALTFTNPEAVLGGHTHKPWIVMDPYRPNHAAQIDGRFCLVCVSEMPGGRSGQKCVQQAWADSLAGPWTWESDALIAPGSPDDFDGKHADAVSGYFFPERGEILYFYMGYPEKEQPRRISPLGSAQGVAVQRVGMQTATKRGVILPPCQRLGHWASGWVGGMQILPGKDHRWIGLLNASPTAPQSGGTEVFREEPPPSLGGWAVCDEEWPVQGWRWMDHPIEWEQDTPADARAAGEGVNFWRQHVLALPGEGLSLFYNSGFYGQEQMYQKIASVEDA